MFMLFAVAVLLPIQHRNWIDADIKIWNLKLIKYYIRHRVAAEEAEAKAVEGEQRTPS